MHRDDLSLEFVRVVEQAAIAAARTMGQGDRKYSDQVAVEAMRKEMETVDIDGTIVIGEGERDEAPMLFIGEKVGKGGPRGGHRRRPPGGHQPLRHRAPPTRSPCWPPPRRAACSTPPTSTWRSWWWARRSRGQGRHQRARRATT